jgi:HAD superfamily hydrolase (TIGR01509 family)
VTDAPSTLTATPPPHPELQPSSDWLVILDCDGVLVDTEPLSIAVDVAVLADLGVPMTAQEVTDLFVGRTHDYWVSVVEGRLGAALPTGWEDDYQHLYEESYREHLRAVDGIVEALDEIRLPTCVASSGGHDKIAFTLGLTGLWSRFEGRVFSASEVAHGKPAPDLFLHAARSLGHKPARCVVVEDSAFGVQAALRAGMTPIAYAGGVTARAKLERPGVTVIDDMRELPREIARITAS